MGSLEHSKDKFLVQSCVVSTEFSGLEEKSKELSDALTSMWNNPSSMVLLNKKLHVKHVVVEPTGTGTNTTTLPSSATLPTPHPPIQSNDSASMVNEITSLRKKYDELVAFSVNLTAE